MTKAKNIWKRIAFVCFLIIMILSAILIISFQKESREYHFSLDKDYHVKITATGNLATGYVVEFYIFRRNSLSLSRRIGYIETIKNFKKFYAAIEILPDGIRLPHAPTTKYIKCQWGTWKIMKADSNCQKLITYWTKGQEFSKVYLADTNEDGVPDEQTISSCILDDEGLISSISHWMEDTNYDGFFDLELTKGCFGPTYKKYILEPVPFISEVFLS